MEKQTYYEQLRDPRWQKKRLEIMERDGWKCRECGNGDETLNVHHYYYIPKCKLWEYQNKAFGTLCEVCHQKWTLYKMMLDVALGSLNAEQLRIVATCVAAVMEKVGPKIFTDWFCSQCHDPATGLKTPEKMNEEIGQSQDGWMQKHMNPTLTP